MNGRRPARKLSSRAVRSPKPGSPLDEQARQILARVVRILQWCGYAPGEIGREALNASQSMPALMPQISDVGAQDARAAAHLLTLWFSDPEYLDSSGSPRQLPLRGARGSLEAVLRQVDAKVEVEKVLAYLLERGTLRRIGKRYVPRERIVFSPPGESRADVARCMRILSAILKTLEHNRLRDPSTTRPWFEVSAYNLAFPRSARDAFDRYVRRYGSQFAEQFDTYMHRQERGRAPDEPTVPLGIGVYIFEEDPIAPAQKKARRRRRGK